MIDQKHQINHFDPSPPNHRQASPDRQGRPLVATADLDWRDPSPPPPSSPACSLLHLYLALDHLLTLDSRHQLTLDLQDTRPQRRVSFLPQAGPRHQPPSLPSSASRSVSHTSWPPFSPGIEKTKPSQFLYRCTKRTRKAYTKGVHEAHPPVLS